MTDKEKIVSLDTEILFQTEKQKKQYVSPVLHTFNFLDGDIVCASPSGTNKPFDPWGEDGFDDDDFFKKSN